MASLGQGSPLPDVQTTTTQATEAPSYYTNYLSNLAQAGQTATAMDPTKTVAGFTDLQQKGFAGLPTAATAYQPGLTAAGKTAADVAGGISSEDIAGFMNPYTSSVVDEMGRLTQQNMQRNIIPGLKGAFVGTGGGMSKRFADVTGQTLADIQKTLTGQQMGALQVELREHIGPFQNTFSIHHLLRNVRNII